MTTASAVDRLRALERRDKWFLSCGDGILWAPPFPRALHFPGFWDEALVYYHPFAPVFTVVLVDQGGHEIPVAQTDRRWYPHMLTTQWDVGNGHVLIEDRYALPGGRLVSEWRSPAGDALRPESYLGVSHLVAFTAQPGDSVVSLDADPSEHAVRWRRKLYDRHNAALDVDAVLRADADAPAGKPSIGALRSEGSAEVPSWSRTPFWEYWTQSAGGGLPDEARLEGISDSGVVYIATGVALEHVRRPSVRFEVRLRAALGGTAERRNGGTIVTAAGPPECHPAVYEDPAAHWRSFFDSFPRFTCSDPFFTRYYDYRLYGLLLNRLSGDSGNVRHPAIAEGIGYFHVPITYSAQCHMWETRWAVVPDVAQGSLLNFLEHQRDDGSLHGRIYTNHLWGTDFYHANWGDALLAVHAVHPDRWFLERAYQGLSRYANWLDASRDSEQTGMYDVVNHYETGQEYMSRYQLVSPKADVDGWDPKLRLKGIDITVYTYQLKRALETVAVLLALPDDAERWAREAKLTGNAITGMMWDRDARWFSDFDPRKQQRTGAKAAVCFYPLLTDLLDDAAVDALCAHLANPTEFGAEYPVPSSSRDDPFFSAYAEWKGKRHNCPWNGRTWPMTNSHIVEGLLRQWQRGRRDVGPLCAHILARFVHMMFTNGEIDRPNCYEHYNPLTGHPSVYRGIDDYQHSWVIDLLIRGVVGLEPRMGGILMDPLPMAVEHAALDGARIAGHRIDVKRDATEISVAVDGKEHTTKVGRPLEIRYD